MVNNKIGRITELYTEYLLEILCQKEKGVSREGKCQASIQTMHIPMSVPRFLTKHRKHYLAARSALRL